MRPVLTFILVLLAAPPAAAACMGHNQIELLAADTRAALVARANAAPHAQGNFWQATKGEGTITLIGTFHLDDPRHEATMARTAPLIDAATPELVEAGPQEEAALKDDLARNPALMFTTAGPTLPESLPPETWAALKQVLRHRSVPPFMAARMQPAFLSMILGGPPWAMADIQAGSLGLDKRIIAHAAGLGIPVEALEPHGTLFTVFDDLTPAGQRDMLYVSLALASQPEDALHTLAESYFAQESRLIWELSRFQAHEGPLLPPEQIDAGFYRMEELLILGCNRAWIPVITATADCGPLLAAFGALHLSGHDGVLIFLRATAGCWHGFPGSGTSRSR